KNAKNIVCPNKKAEKVHNYVELFDGSSHFSIKVTIKSLLPIRLLVIYKYIPNDR
ncbi:hypothetical protein HispidOSU_002617, partial [Sigmodon hispidus]